MMGGGRRRPVIRGTDLDAQNDTKPHNYGEKQADVVVGTARGRRRVAARLPYIV